MSRGTLEYGRSHAASETTQRLAKARKISRLLGLDADAVRPLRVLEVGCGSGAISHWLGMRGHIVMAVDVVDERVIHDGYQFRMVDSALLPFPDQSFDVLISNHVIEHVGDSQAQLRHLKEMRRLAASGARAYLAVPNRWMLVEPHYGLPLLSWLPSRLADLYVRITGKAACYDCRPFTRGQLERALCSAGWSYQQLHREALKVLCEEESTGKMLAPFMLRWIPIPLYRLLAPIFPTLIYRLWPATTDSIE